MEVKIGKVTHYYTHLGVAAIELDSDKLDVGDIIHIKGHTTDLVQPVDSIELEHHQINEAKPGQNVGIKVKDHVREHDEILKVMM